MTLSEFFRNIPRAVAGVFRRRGFVLSVYMRPSRPGRRCSPTIKTAFQPQFELHDAQRLCDELGVELMVLYRDVLSHDEVCKNPADRCYHCKRVIFEALSEQAARDGYDVVLDGTNASDDAGDRPGMRALAELCVYSPLRECGLTPKTRSAAVPRPPGAFHARQTRLRLPRHAHPHGRSDHAGGFVAHRKRGGHPLCDGLFRPSRAPFPRRGAHSASRAAVFPRRQAA